MKQYKSVFMTIQAMLWEYSHGKGYEKYSYALAHITFELWLSL